MELSIFKGQNSKTAKQHFMSSKYQITDPDGIYFLTSTIVDWVDVFTRPQYKIILVDSLNYSILNKGLVLYAYVLMSNHLHMIASARTGFNLSDILRDFKKFTSKRIISSIKKEPSESRRKWLLNIFCSHGKHNPNNWNYQFWQQSNHAVLLDSNRMIDQRLDYIHNNPVKSLIVDQSENYIYSSAIDYCGGKGLVNITLLD